MQEQSDEQRKMQAIEKRVQEHQRYNFAERYVGASLSKLDAETWIAESIVKWIKNPKNFLVYHGSPGIGKTYLCAALSQWSLTHFDSRRYYREENLLRKLRSSIGEGKGEYLDTLQFLIDDEVVILDDVGSGINPEKESKRDLEFRREIFFSFLDYRYNSMKPTIITSNFSKDDFKNVYSERIFSRLFAKENTIITIDNGIDKRSLGI